MVEEEALVSRGVERARQGKRATDAQRLRAANPLT
jgi:hypothetical protein